MKPVLREIGAFIPPGRVSNHERLEDFGMNREVLLHKIGVDRRAIIGPTMNTSDLCVGALENLQQKIQIDMSAIELVSVVTQNPDYRIPHTAAVVHQKLKLPKKCMTFDISQGCAGYTHGIAVVSALMQTLKLKQALLFTADPYSKVVDRNDRNTALLFGDAASVSFLSDTGRGYEIAHADFATLPDSVDWLKCQEKIAMDGREVLRNAGSEVPKSIRTLLGSAGLAVNEVDLFVMHQASRSMLDLLRESFDLTDVRMPFDIADFGNTVSSSIPIMLQRHINNERARHIVLSGFGAGFTIGSVLLKLRSGE